MILVRKQNILQTAGSALHGKYYANACITLNARTVPVAFALRRVSQVLFLIASS